MIVPHDFIVRFWSRRPDRPRDHSGRNHSRGCRLGSLHRSSRVDTSLRPPDIAVGRVRLCRLAASAVVQAPEESTRIVLPEKKKKIKSVAAREILKNCFLPFQGKEEGIPWHVALLLLEDSHTLHREEEHPSEYTCKEGSIRVPCQKMREQVCLPFRTMNTTEFISLINSP